MAIVNKNLIKQVSWRDYRDKLLPIVREAAIKNNHRFAENIDKALLEKRAFLFLVEDGFFVLSTCVRDKSVYVEIDFAFSFGAHAMSRYHNAVERLTKEIHGRGIIAYTAVKTVEKKLKRIGYEVESVDGHVCKLIKVL